MKRKDNIALQLGCQGFELQGSGRSRFQMCHYQLRDEKVLEWRWQNFSRSRPYALGITSRGTFSTGEWIVHDAESTSRFIGTQRFEARVTTLPAAKKVPSPLGEG